MTCRARPCPPHRAGPHELLNVGTGGSRGKLTGALEARPGPGRSKIARARDERPKGSPAFLSCCRVRRWETRDDVGGHRRKQAAGKGGPRVCAHARASGGEKFGSGDVAVPPQAQRPHPEAGSPTPRGGRPNTMRTGFWVPKGGGVIVPLMFLPFVPRSSRLSKPNQ